MGEACKGVCGTSDVKDCNDKAKPMAAKQAGGPRKQMDPSLYAAMMLYTGDAIYTQLNKTLRDTDRSKLKKYFKYLRLFFEAADCLPEQKKTLWRGISVDLNDNPQYAVGKTVTWWGVSSCTTDKKVADGFASSCGGGCTVVTVEAKKAIDISKISVYSNEKESILCPGTQLKVKSKTKKGNITLITLQEVGRAID